MTLNGPVVDMPAGVVYTQGKLYAVTVTVKQGDQEVTKRYEAPTAEEAKRMAGECDVEQTPTGGK